MTEEEKKQLIDFFNKLPKEKRDEIQEKAVKDSLHSNNYPTMELVFIILICFLISLLLITIF